MRLLDLFSGAGGSAVGYHRAGFDVTGVDNRPQKRYPFAFIQADALEYVREHGHEYDAIHASPPCQAYSAMRTMPNARQNHPDLVAPTREALIATGRPWVIENVPGAPLRNYIVLCGSMFGLGVGDAELRRHRLFELSFDPPMVPPCSHALMAVPVYGHSGGRSTREMRRRAGLSMRSTAAQRREAMGIDWMSLAELSQAIPPAYCEWIGRHLLAALAPAAPVR